MRSRLPALGETAKTARQGCPLHTVTRELDPELSDLLESFDRATGVPLVVNTSFNVAGEPIVASAEDAISCFYSCGLDSLMLAGFSVHKELS